AMRYRKPGTPDYEVIMTDLIDGGAEMQAGFLADEGYIDRTYQNAAEGAFPEPEMPVRKEGESDELFDRRAEAFETTMREMGAKRQKFVEEAYDGRLRSEREATDTGDRLQRCITALYQRKRQDAFGKQFVIETLARAVRDEHDHRKLYFIRADGEPDTAAVADLDDPTREALSMMYFALDKVTPQQIPTSADGSRTSQGRRPTGGEA